MKAKNKKLLGIGLLAMAVFLLLRKQGNQKTTDPLAGKPRILGSKYKLTKDFPVPNDQLDPAVRYLKMPVMLRTGEVISGPLIRNPLQKAPVKIGTILQEGVYVEKGKYSAFVPKSYLKKV